MLYKTEDYVPVSGLGLSTTAAMPTYLQFAPPPEDPVADLGVSDSTTMIPGSSLVCDQPGWLYHPVYTDPHYTPTTFLIQHPWPMPAACIAGPAYAAPENMESRLGDQLQLPRRDSMFSVMPLSHSGGCSVPCQPEGPKFRPSFWTEPAFAAASRHSIEFRTAQFKKYVRPFCHA